MNDQEERQVLLLRGLITRATRALERLCPAVSPPETGSRTRGAGSKPGDPQEYSSELPFADQAEALSEQWLAEADRQAKEADAFMDKYLPMECDTALGKEAGLREAAAQLKALIAAGRAAAQSDRSEGEGCGIYLPFGWHCQKDDCLLEAPCDACPTPGAGMERSGSANDQTEARDK